MVETPCSWSAPASGTSHGQVTVVETRLAIVTVVETPQLQLVSAGGTSGRSQWLVTLQLGSAQRGRVASHSGKDTDLAVGQCSGDEWQATVAKTLTLQLVSAAGTNGKPQWQRQLAKRNPLHHQYHLHGHPHIPSIAFRHLPPRKDVVNQCLEFGPSPQVY